MAYIKAPKPKQQPMYDYLERLRQSGVTNMWGARPYLEEEFGLDKKEAGEILSDWMDGHQDSTRRIEAKA